MQSKKVKLTLEIVLQMLNEGYSVYQIAQRTGNREWSVRYILRKNGCVRKVEWICPQQQDSR